MLNIEAIQAAEQYVSDLLKIEPALAQHLKALRAVAPESAKFVAQKMFTDHMVEGVGNKAAYDDFLSRPRKGIHVLLDGNDFGRVNKEWGQSVGDEAIKAMGAAVSRASRANRGKLFRVGGDEFRAHFETPEQAHSFIRYVREELERLPPVKGRHHHSVSIGIGHTPEHAEQALIHAKNAKKLAGYAPGHAMTHAHSLLEGAAGAVAVTKPPEIPPSIRKPIQPGQSPLALPDAGDMTPVQMAKSEALQKMMMYGAAFRHKPTGKVYFTGAFHDTDSLAEQLGKRRGTESSWYKPNEWHEGFVAGHPKGRFYTREEAARAVGARGSLESDDYARGVEEGQYKSEDEFADMRFQAALRKMAVIHDNPQQPMKVWRVQNDAGEGPYSRGSKLSEEARDMVHSRSPVEAPDPHADFSEGDIDEWCQANPDVVKFGFQSPEHAERWFGRDALASMRGSGFTLRQALARKVWRSKSGRQVMFEPHQP